MPAPFGRKNRVTSDKRSLPRLPICLPGRFLRERSRDDLICEAVNLSVGGMFLHAKAKPMIGERVILYINNLGRFEGRVVRTDREGFGVVLHLTMRARRALQVQMIWLAKLSQKAVTELRAYERVVPHVPVATITTASGLKTGVRLIDISRGGASFAGPAPFRVGDQIKLGNTRSRIVSVSSERVAVQFAAPVAEKQFSAAFQP